MPDSVAPHRSVNGDSRKLPPRLGLRLCARRVRRCLPFPAYACVFSGTGFALAVGLAVYVLNYSDPPAALVVAGQQVELRVAGVDDGPTLIALDPALKHGSREGTHTLELGGGCDWLSIRVDRIQGSESVSVRFAPYAMRPPDSRVECPAHTAVLQTTTNGDSLAATSLPSVPIGYKQPLVLTLPEATVSEEPRETRPAAGLLFAAQSILSFAMPNVETGNSSGPLATESLKGRSLRIVADQWELSQLSITWVDAGPMLTASLGSPEGVSKLAVGTDKDLLRDYRANLWFSRFLQIFGTTTLLDLIKVFGPCVAKRRARAKKKARTRGDAVAKPGVATT